MSDSDDSSDNQLPEGSESESAPEAEGMRSAYESTTDEPSLVGRVLGGKYLILEKLGQGGMGVVYKAEQTYVDRIVAIKILHSHLTANKTFLKRFHHEARINSRITHPNAVMLYDFGIEDGMPYLVLEFVQGITLKDTLAQQGALPVARINRILKQVGSALAAAHELGIVHRDLKPDNIMLTNGSGGEDEVRVLDFGIAKALHQTSDQNNTMVTQAGVLMGTPAYISPELAMERELDARSDIYSLGVILFEMLTGEVPFKSSSPLETYIQHIRNQPPLVRELKPELNIPKEVGVVVSKALEKEPANRYQFVGEMIRAFDFAVSKTQPAGPIAKPLTSVPARPVETPSSTQQKSIPTLAKEKPRFNKALWGSVAFAGTALLAIFLIPQFLEQQKTESIQEPQVIEPEGARSEVAPASADSNAGDRDEQIQPVAANDDQAVIEAPKEAQSEAPTAVDPTARALAPNDSAALEASPENAPASAPPTSEVQSETQSADVDLSGDVAPITPEQSAAVEPASEPSTLNTADQAAAEQQPAIPAADDEVSRALLGPDSADRPKLSPQKAKAESERLAADGEKLLDKKDYMAAGLQLKKALSLDENNLAARLSFGSALLRLGKTQNAIEQFQKALTLDAEYAPTHYSLASAYALANEPERAIESLQHAAKLFPGVSKWLTNDVDFVTLKDDARYQALLGKK
ncbi:MAG: protein kinase [Bdellovibrionota bacterium]